MEKESHLQFNDYYERERSAFTSDDLVEYHVSITKNFTIKQEEVELNDSYGVKGYRKGLYNFPNSIVSWGLTEINPGVKSLFHRQLHEATHFILEGKGYSLINGVRFDWKKGDVVFTPVHSWHQVANDGKERVRYATAGTVPFFKYLGIYNDENHRKPTQDELSKLRKDMPPTLVVKEEEWLPQTLAKKQVVFPFPNVVATNRMSASMPPKSENKFVHRHFTEALIYIMQGHGYSLVHDRKVEWEPGTVMRVPTFCWHTHSNPSDEPEVHLRHVSTGLNNHLQWNLINNLPPRDIKETPLREIASQFNIGG